MTHNKKRPRGRPFKKAMEPNLKPTESPVKTVPPLVKTLAKAVATATPGKAGIDEIHESMPIVSKAGVVVADDEEIGWIKSDESVTPSSGKFPIVGIPSQENLESYILLETIDFFNGENSLKITLSRKGNKTFRTEIILNGITEIRPQTYTGASKALSFWNLLKGAVQ